MKPPTGFALWTIRVGWCLTSLIVLLMPPWGRDYRQTWHELRQEWRQCYQDARRWLGLL